MVRRHLCTTLLGFCFGIVQLGPAVADLREGVSAYARQDYPRAFRILMVAAQRGDAEAQTLVGFMYAHGRGVPQNFVAAVSWYRRASKQGEARAQYLLGLMYDKGQGVPVNAVEAYKWLNLAVAGAPEKDRPAWVRIRDAVGSKLSLAELDHAQRLALEWRAGQRRWRGDGCSRCRAFDEGQ